jgi:hypothetical protein
VIARGYDDIVREMILLINERYIINELLILFYTIIAEEAARYGHSELFKCCIDILSNKADLSLVVEHCLILSSIGGHTGVIDYILDTHDVSRVDLAYPFRCAFENHRFRIIIRFLKTGRISLCTFMNSFFNATLYWTFGIK